MTNNTGKYNFIKLEKVIVRNFSLYPKNENIIDEKINDGVYCLAGANGLGKTTFLNILNYGLTGLVLKPKKEVFEPGLIFKNNKDYTSDYFKGRIAAKDEHNAEIELNFTINNVHFRLVRGFFELEELRLLEIYKIENGKSISIKHNKVLSPKELNVLYQDSVTKEIGIGKFEYFIFFQLYVLTFDEDRRMLFWDDRAMSHSLTIAFNQNPTDAEKTIELKRQMEKLESDGRNARWQATQIKYKIESLIKTQEEKEKNNWDQLKKEYDELFFEVEESEKEYKNTEIEYDTLLKRQNIVNSEILQQKTKYKKLFSQYSEPRSTLLNNQYVVYSRKKSECFLCGSSGHYVVENIERNLHQEKCPICNTSINEGNSVEQDKLLNELSDIDKKIENKTQELDNLIFETEAKKVELEKKEFKYYSSKEKLRNFEKENSKLNFNNTGNLPLDDLINDYRKQFERFDKESEDYYKKRDKLRPVYDNLIEKINTEYKDAEEFFVPLFKEFSKSFIGLDLNIYFKKKGKDISLNFELLGTSRTKAFQLSESQRFFLDIALRMALATYLSKKQEGATILVDTPEGSLDIAYESRVGKMFADFVTKHNQNVIMTANINASQLLVSLAEKCGYKKMKFRRMLEWTELTDIQKEGEYLFEQVYKNIELSLKRNKNE